MYGFIHVHNTHACTHKRTYGLAWRGVVKISEPILVQSSPIPRNNIIIIWSISHQNMYERLIAFTCCPYWDPLVDVKCNMFVTALLGNQSCTLCACACECVYLCVHLCMCACALTYIWKCLRPLGHLNYTHTHTFRFCTFFEKKNISKWSLTAVALYCTN